MALPTQTDPIADLRRSQEFWRLKRELVSAGDLFEIDVATRAIYIGPESDISEVELAYFDPQQALVTQTVIVSPNGPFVGRFDSNHGPDTIIPATGLPGRIIARAADFVDPNYIPPFAIGAQPKRRFLLRPIIDLICALNELPDIPDVRADKTFRLPQVPFEGNAANLSTDVIIPVYGRKLISVYLVVPINVDLTMTFEAVILQPGGSTSPGLSQPRLLASTTIAAATVVRTFPFVLRASSDVRALVDTANATDQVLDPIPGPIGNFDYLRMNIVGVGLAPGLLANVELFVRMSDREI